MFTNKFKLFLLNIFKSFCVILLFKIKINLKKIYLIIFHKNLFKKMSKPEKVFY